MMLSKGRTNNNDRCGRFICIACLITNRQFFTFIHSWVKTEWLKKTPSFEDQNQIDCFSVMFLLSNDALHSNRNQVKIASPITLGLSDLTVPMHSQHCQSMCNTTDLLISVAVQQGNTAATLGISWGIHRLLDLADYQLGVWGACHLGDFQIIVRITYYYSIIIRQYSSYLHDQQVHIIQSYLLQLPLVISARNCNYVVVV